MLLFVAFFCILLVSCNKNKQGVVADLSDLESVSIQEQWAMIFEPYVALRKEPTENSDISAHCRRGDVFLVKGSSIQTRNGQTEMWYDLGSGWILGSSIRIYSNKLQAENAAK